MLDFEFEFQYAEEKTPVLRQTAGSIPKGRCVVLCGGSGCGKSTLLRCINGSIPQFYEGELKGYGDDCTVRAVLALPICAVKAVAFNVKVNVFH